MEKKYNQRLLKNASPLIFLTTMHLLDAFLERVKPMTYIQKAIDTHRMSTRVSKAETISAGEEVY